MRARLEGDHQRSATGVVAGGPQRGDLGMSAARRLGGTGTHHMTRRRHHDGTQPRGSARCACVPATALDRLCHRCRIVHLPVPRRPGGRRGTATTNERWVCAHTTVRRTSPCSHPDCYRRPRSSTESAAPEDVGFAGCDRRSGLAPNPAGHSVVTSRLAEDPVASRTQPQRVTPTSVGSAPVHARRALPPPARGTEQR
jgi:hypothetical protein